MYLIDLNSLMKQWKADAFSIRDSANYLFAQFAYGIITAVPFDILEEPKDSMNLELKYKVAWFVIGSAILVGIIRLFLDKFYIANGGDDGTNFLAKLFSLGFVVQMHIILVYFPFRILYLNFPAGRQGHLLVSLIFITVAIGSVIYWYKTLTRCLRELQEFKTQN
jgi:hypothetical protein